MDAATRFVRPTPEPARLTSAQKRDLFGIAASALVTSALIAAPLIIADAPAPTVMAARVDTAFAGPLLEHTPASVLLLAPAPVDAPALPPLRRRPSPSLRSVAGIPAVADVRPSADTHDRTQRKALGRRLTGLFTGDGTYSVRPFPTVATER